MRSSQTCRQGQRSKHANASLQLHSCIVGLAVLQHWGILIKAKTPAATARSPPRSRLQEQQALNTCTVSGGKQNQQQGEVQWCCIIWVTGGPVPAGHWQATSTGRRCFASFACFTSLTGSGALCLQVVSLADDLVASDRPFAALVTLTLSKLKNLCCLVLLNNSMALSAAGETLTPCVHRVVNT